MTISMKILPLFLAFIAKIYRFSSKNTFYTEGSYFLFFTLCKRSQTCFPNPHRAKFASNDGANVEHNRS
jgi:hypothetical protein